MSVNSNRKGKEGELDFCNHLKDMGYDARRSVQFQGVPVEGAGDVITNVEGVRFEVKRYKDAPRLWNKQMRDWMDQAIAETPEGKMPVIAIRGNREPWRYVMPRREGASESLVMIPATEHGTYLIEWYAQNR